MYILGSLRFSELTSWSLTGDRKGENCSVGFGKDRSCAFRCCCNRSNSHTKAQFCFWEWFDALNYFAWVEGPQMLYILKICAGNLSRKLSSASSLGSMEESYFLQASLDSSDSFSERRNAGELTMNPYFMKSMTPSAFEAALRQKEGELASYMSRLVWSMF